MQPNTRRKTQTTTLRATRDTTRLGSSVTHLVKVGQGAPHPKALAPSDALRDIPPAFFHQWYPGNDCRVFGLFVRASGEWRNETMGVFPLKFPAQVALCVKVRKAAEGARS